MGGWNICRLVEARGGALAWRAWRRFLGRAWDAHRPARSECSRRTKWTSGAGVGALVCRSAGPPRQWATRSLETRTVRRSSLHTSRVPSMAARGGEKRSVHASRAAHAPFQPDRRRQLATIDKGEAIRDPTGWFCPRPESLQIPGSGHGAHQEADTENAEVSIFGTARGESGLAKPDHRKSVRASL